MRLANSICLGALIVAGAGACSMESGSDVVELTLHTDDKTDSWGTAEISEMFYPPSLSWETAHWLPPGEMVGVALPGAPGLPMLVRAEHDEGMLNDLEMSVLVGQDPEGADAEQVSEAGAFWISPAATVEEPQAGLWYFFIIRNTGTSMRAVEISVESTRKRFHSLIGSSLSVGTGRCHVDLANSLFTGGFELQDLVPGQTYSVVVSSNAENIILFEGYYEGFDLIDRNLNPLGSFYWPNYETQNPHEIAYDDSEDGLLHIVFEASQEDHIVYGVAVSRHPVLIGLGVFATDFTVDAWLCEGSEPCPPNC